MQLPVSPLPMQKLRLVLDQPETQQLWIVCPECCGEFFSKGQTRDQAEKRAEMLLSVHLLRDHHTLYQGNN